MGLARFCEGERAKICDLKHACYWLAPVSVSYSERTGFENIRIGTTPPSRLVIASRESRLAMWQAEHVRERLTILYPQCDVKIVGMTTRGDQILDRTLSKVGGKGLFVKELEVAMAEGRADLVHSLKDVPMELPGFCAGRCAGARRSRDAFVSNDCLAG
jgi:hydroxymethylbilane synthase